MVEVNIVSTVNAMQRYKLYLYYMDVCYEAGNVSSWKVRVVLPTYYNSSRHMSSDRLQFGIESGTVQLAAGRIRSFITLDSGILDYTRMLTTRFKSAQIACRYSNLGSQVLNRRCNYHCTLC